MKIFLLFLSTLFICTLIFSGCKKINPDEEIPSYIKITGYTFAADTVNQGSRIHSFNDFWVYTSNGQLIGCFSMGTSIPVLAEGPTTLLIRAGIKNCGTGDLRSFYPVTQFYSLNIDLKRGQLQEVSPVFSYYTGITFLSIESFNNPGTFLSQTLSSDTMLVQYNGAEAMVGQGNCAHVYLDDTHPVFDAQSGAPHPYIQGAPCFLEMNFKSDLDFFVSVSNGTNDIRLACKFKASPTWKKMYVNLTDYLNSPGLLSNFYLVLHAAKSTAGGAAHIYFDNIKLIRQY